MKRDYKIDVYDARLRIANDKKSAYCEDNENDSPCCSIYGHNKKWWVVIYLPDTCLRKACHESVHGAASLLDTIGLDISAKDQEALAWLTDYIFSKCQDFIARLPSEK